MTVPTTVAYSGPYFPNGATTQYPFGFKVNSDSEVVVFYLETDGTETIVPSANYTVALSSNVNNPGGTITTTAPLPADATRPLYVAMDPEFTQNTKFEDEGAFNQSILNPTFDAGSLRSIWLRARINRALLVPFGEQGVTLPRGDARASKFLGFDALGGLAYLSGTGVDGAFRSDVALGTGGNLIGFLQTGAGAQLRTMLDKVRERVSVRDYLGILTATAAFQAALATGADIYVPRGTYVINTTLTTSAIGQRIYGDGASSIIEQSGVNANSTCLILAHANCAATDLHFKPNPTTASQVYGYGVAITGSRCRVEGCHVSGMMRGGVGILDANDCIIRGNIFRDSAVVPSPALLQQNTGADVMCLGTASNNIIEGNQCISGCGGGVFCQTGTSGKSQAGNIVRGNRIKGQPCYAIMGYLSDVADRIDDMVIEGNTIEDISGQIYVNAGANLFYGAGIYLQTVSRCVVRGNHIQRTNTDRSLPRSGSDSPAAIAISGRTNGVVEGNFIQDCYYGIQISQAVNAESDKDGLVISNNVIRPGPVRPMVSGIQIASTYSMLISGNDIVGTSTAATSRGIFVFHSGITTQEIVITGNRCVSANNGIEITGAALRATITNNHVRDCANYGIFATALSSIVSLNDITGAVNGIGLSGTVTKGIIDNNLISASGTPINDGSVGGASRAGNRYSVGAMQGSAVLVAGTILVNTVEVRAGDRIILSRGAAGGGLGDLSVGAIVAATSFVINSSSATDTSTIFWRIEH